MVMHGYYISFSGSHTFVIITNITEFQTHDSHWCLSSLLTRTLLAARTLSERRAFAWKRWVAPDSNATTRTSARLIMAAVTNVVSTRRAASTAVATPALRCSLPTVPPDLRSRAQSPARGTEMCTSATRRVCQSRVRLSRPLNTDSSLTLRYAGSIALLLRLLLLRQLSCNE